MTSIDLGATSLEVIRAGQWAGGAFIAGPTFSQYGYAWLRDGAFIAAALDDVGQHEMALRFHRWVAAVVDARADGIERSIESVMAGQMPAATDYLHCRYTPDGEPGPDDWPTFQLDGPGIWLWSLGRHARAVAPGAGPSASSGLEPSLIASAERVGRYLAALWRLPAADAWEEFPDQVHTSTLAADLAGLRALRELSPVAGGSAEIRDAIAGIETRLFGPAGDDSPWTKFEGTDLVDSSLLWIAVPYGLVAPSHPRFAATLARIEQDLVSADGGAHRYADDTYYGGGAWLLLTAALGQVYLERNGPADRARAWAALRWIEAQANSAGRLPEQVATHALHPDRIAEWRAMWGESASPLLWSHATYLALRKALETSEAVDSALPAEPAPADAEQR